MVKSSKSSKSSKSKSTPHSVFSPRNIILAVIIAVTIVVCGSFIASIFLKPERLVPQQIEALATNYYENVFYENMLNSDQFSGDAEATLSEYSIRGLAIITLRQLLLQDEAATADVADYLRNYCDENATTVHFYPEPPYTRTAYRTEYNYACNY